MGTRSRESDSDCATSAAAKFNAVFVDTSLDTHFAMLVSDTDTVLDFRKKIVLEHMKCFPAVGEIKIQSLKVKRRSKFYNLPDVMLVWSAFQGTKRDWFLSADASTVIACHLNQNSCEIGTSDCVKVKDTDINRMELPMAFPNDTHERNGVSGMTAGVKFDKSLETTTDTCLEENCVETKPRAKMKQKITQTEDVCHNPSLRDSCTELRTSSDARYNQSHVEGAHVEVAAENGNSDSYKRKDDMMALEGIARENFELEREPDQDCPTESFGVTSNAVPDWYTKSKIGIIDVKEDVKSDGNKRKEKTSKMGADVHNKTHVQQTGKGAKFKLCAETHKSEGKEGEKDLSLNHDHDMTTPSSKKSLDIGGPHLVQNERFSPHLDAFPVGEPEISSGSNKKRKQKNKNWNKMMEGGEKPSNDNPGINGSSGLISPSIDHNPEGGDKEESTLHHKGEDVQLNVCKDAGEEVQGADWNGAEFVVSTQNCQSKDVTSAERTVQKISQISLGKGNEDFPPMVKDQIAEFNQVVENGENQENKDKKAKKKRKWVQLSASDVSVMEEALQVAILNNDHKTNRVLYDVKNVQLNAEATAKTGNFHSDRKKENMELDGMMPENAWAIKLGQDVSTESLEVSSTKVPDCSTRLMDSNGAVEDVTSKTNQRKKNKTNKMAANFQDKTGVEPTGKCDTEFYTEICKPEENVEEKTLSLRQDCEVTNPSNKNYSDATIPNPAQKESTDAHTVVKPDISSGSKKKNKKVRKGKIFSDTNMEKSCIEQRNNGVGGSSGLICPSADYNPEASDKEQSTLNHEQQDAQMKLLKCSSKVQSADGNGADFVMLTQTSQTLEDVASAERVVGKKTQSSTSCKHEDFAPIEKDQILDFNQVDKNGENIENRDGKAKKKRKKVKHATADASENFPVEVQKAGVEVSAPERNLDNLVQSKKEDRHITSTATLYTKSEEEVVEKNGTSANTSDHTKMGGEQRKDSGNVEKKATKSNSEKGGKVNVNNLPPIELQNKLKSSEHQESELQSQVRKTSGKRREYLNSQHVEVVPNSSKTCATVAGIEEKDSTPSEIQQRKTLQKPDEKNVSLKKSSLEMSKPFPESQGNKKVQTNRLVMKTPQKKSLFSKQGSKFQYNSGESSGDENWTVYSESSAHSPSDSSSLSSDSESVGERDLSQGRTRNGSTGAGDQSAGGKIFTKLDLSDSKEITMEMILRSSKRFKKAKLLASQNELKEYDSQPIEFVPDSQPI